MLKRTLTGAVILLVTVAFVLLKQVHLLFFDALVLIISIGSILEIYKAFKVAGKKINIYMLVLMPILNCLIFNLKNNLYKAFLLELVAVVCLFVCLMSKDIVVFAINRKNGTTEPDVSKLNSTLFDETKYTMMALAYPVLMISFLFALNHLSYDVGYMGIVVVFAVSMLTDTSALIFGMLFGKTKFVPEVSPKKTVEGMIGGLFGGIVGALICFLIFYFSGLFALSKFSLLNSIVAFALVGLVGSFLTQLGDLVASAFKRKVGIKDYANIFPGHGGFMDRVDGLMFNAAFVYLIFALFLV